MTFLLFGHTEFTFANRKRNLPVTSPCTGTSVSSSVFLAQMQFIMVNDNRLSRTWSALDAFTSLTNRSMVSTLARRIRDIFSLPTPPVYDLHKYFFLFSGSASRVAASLNATEIEMMVIVSGSLFLLAKMSKRGEKKTGKCV